MPLLLGAMVHWWLLRVFAYELFITVDAQLAQSYRRTHTFSAPRLERLNPLQSTTTIRGDHSRIDILISTQPSILPLLNPNPTREEEKEEGYLE